MRKFSAPLPVLLTVDTELSVAMHQNGISPVKNFEKSITGRTYQGDFGVAFQMEHMAAHGHKGIFFVDPLPALLYGELIIADMVGPIIEAGHYVELHAHPEWLQFCDDPPVPYCGDNIGDYSLADQLSLLEIGRIILMRAGAPSPRAFRAGNYGANDDTLRALAQLGIAHDSSFNASYRNAGSAITLPAEQNDPIEYLGVTEWPVSQLRDPVSSYRPAQICALSVREFDAALSHSFTKQTGMFTIVTHSFEMLSRDRERPNNLVIDRFLSLLNVLAQDRRYQSRHFDDIDTGPLSHADLLPANIMRTAWRMGEQVYGRWRYERGGSSAS